MATTTTIISTIIIIFILLANCGPTKSKVESAKNDVDNDKEGDKSARYCGIYRMDPEYACRENKCGTRKCWCFFDIDCVHYKSKEECIQRFKFECSLNHPEAIFDFKEFALFSATLMLMILFVGGVLLLCICRFGLLSKPSLVIDNKPNP